MFHFIHTTPDPHSPYRRLLRWLRRHMTRNGRALRERLAEWRGLLGRQIPQARQILKKLLDGPVVFEPVREGIREGWRFVGFGKLSALLHGTKFAKFVASPTGFEPPAFVLGGPLVGGS